MRKKFSSTKSTCFHAGLTLLLAGLRKNADTDSSHDEQAQTCYSGRTTILRKMGKLRNARKLFRYYYIDRGWIGDQYCLLLVEAAGRDQYKLLRPIKDNIGCKGLVCR